MSTTYFAAVGYRKIQLASTIHFDEKIKNLPDLENINHFIVIPNYKEPRYKLEQTVRKICQSDYPIGKKMYLVLAFEKREEKAPQKADYLRKKFSHYFADILETYHVLMPGEVPGKASNQTHAARELEKYVQEKGFDFKKTLITICDADSIMPSNFFSYLTYKYIHDKDKDYHFYWAPVLLYNNFWELPFFVRIQATLSSILRLAFVAQTDKLIQISTYTSNLWLLKQVDYWDVDIIPEDWHIHLQAFFAFGDKVRTIPLFTIVNGDAVYSGGLVSTLMNRYEQEKRWAWGVTDVAYMWNKFFHTPHIPVWSKIKKIFYIGETHFLWPTSFFMLAISASLPALINPVFKRTVLGFGLPQLSGFILTFSSLFLLLYIYLDFSLRKKLKVEHKPQFLPILVVQWYLLPAISFILSALPALDAHTRLLFGRRITYKVTEKV